MTKKQVQALAALLTAVLAAYAAFCGEPSSPEPEPTPVVDAGVVGPDAGTEDAGR